MRKKFECSICREKRNKKIKYTHKCKKNICADCLLENLLNFGRLKCPFCRINYSMADIINFVDNRNSINLKPYGNKLISNIFKNSINNSEVIEKLYRNVIVKGLISLSDEKSRLNKGLISCFDTLVDIFYRLPPLLISIHEEKNILLIRFQDISKIRYCPYFEDFMRILNIKAIGCVDSLENIKMFEIEKYSIPMNFKYDSDLVSIKCDVEKIRDKLESVKITYIEIDNLDIKFSMICKHIITLKIMKYIPPNNSNLEMTIPQNEVFMSETGEMNQENLFNNLMAHVRKTNKKRGFVV